MGFKNAILTEYQKERIIRMREDKIPWTKIAKYPGESQAKMYISRHEFMKDLPLKSRELINLPPLFTKSTPPQ